MIEFNEFMALLGITPRIFRLTIIGLNVFGLFYGLWVMDFAEKEIKEIDKFLKEIGYVESK